VSKARLVITAVIVEQRPVREVAAAYGVSRSWIYELVARYRVEGDAAFEPRSRRPRSSPNATPAEVVDLIVRLRDEFTLTGLDAGPSTIRWHLRHHHDVSVAASTIHRVLRAANRVTDQPQKRPRSSYIRFQAEQPNETWQADFTHHRLATGHDAEILTWLDDHSRYALSVTAHHRVTGTTVVDTFTACCHTHGAPASTLTDNGMVFTTRLSGGRGGRNGLETLLDQLGIRQKNSRPNHPTTCGKVERFQQTMKKWLRTQTPAATIAELQHHIDSFVDTYNHHRPHHSLDDTTPHVAYQARPKAAPTGSHHPHLRVRHDRIHNGRVSLRHNGHLHHIGLGRTLDGTRVILLIDDLDIRVIHHHTGEIIRHLTLDTTRNYQPTGNPTGGPKGTRKPQRTNPT
jgi:transposase InsO family protein